MTDLQKVADDAQDRLLDAYYKICDARGEAVDPRDLVDETWAIDLLDSAFEIMLKVEDVKAVRNISWGEAREFV